MTIVGDVLHSRVARSNVLLLSTLGAEVTLVAPPTLLPLAVGSWPCAVSYDLDSELPKSDVVMMLRVQQERMTAAYFPSVREYSRRYGLDAARMARLPEHAIVMHPGPMNRGVEIAAEVADSARSTIVEQVANGVTVRMAVLYLLLGGTEFPRRGRPYDGATADWLITGRQRSAGRASSPPTSCISDGRDRGRRPGPGSPAGARALDAGGLIALPGLVDLHTHLREPGREDAETVETGTAAAALGGLHRGARDGQHRPGGRHRRGGRAGLAARPHRRGTATSSRSARSPSAWTAPGWPSSARWRIRPPGSGCSPTTAGACPTRC